MEARKIEPIKLNQREVEISASDWFMGKLNVEKIKRIE